jgi:hypothetical protein
LFVDYPHLLKYGRLSRFPSPKEKELNLLRVAGEVPVVLLIDSLGDMLVSKFLGIRVRAADAHLSTTVSVPVQ